MTRLEELNVLIDNQSIAVNEARTAVRVVEETYEEEIKKTITAFLSAVAPVKVYMSARGFSASGRVDLAETDKTIFDFYYDTEYGTKEYRLTVNIGTCGSFGIKDEAEILKYRVFSAFLDNFEEIEKVFKNTGTLYDLVSAYYAKDNVLSTYMREKQEIERKAQEQKIIDLIKVGNIYINVNYRWYNKSGGFKGYKYVKLVSLTEKSANLEVGYINPKGSYSEGWGMRDTYRMNKQEFFKDIIYGRLKETTVEAEMLKQE